MPGFEDRENVKDDEVIWVYDILNGAPMVDVSELNAKLDELKGKCSNLPSVESIRDKQKPETYTEDQFIIPLLEALGWERGPSHLPYYVRQRRLPGAAVMWEDFFLEIGQHPEVIIEAKSIFEEGILKYQGELLGYLNKYNNENIEGNTVYWGILTNFKEFYVFHYGDKEHVERFTWDTLDPKTLCDWFSPKGLVDENLSYYYKEKRKQPLGEVFLNDLKKWRLILANGFLASNPSLSLDEVKEASQRFLDRLIFIRILEAKRVIKPEFIRTRFLDWTRDLFPGKFFSEVLRDSFKDFEGFYNTELLKENLCDRIPIKDEVLEEVIKVSRPPSDEVKALIPAANSFSERGLYGYNFMALTIDVMGAVYERYLAHRIDLKDGKMVIEDTPELRKKEGAYYTPSYVVDYIVNNTVVPQVNAVYAQAEKHLNEYRFSEAYQKIREISGIKVLDPACGSGSFLIKAFETISGSYKNYNALYEEKEKEWSIKFGGNRIDSNLTAYKVLDIGTCVLLENIFGVDLDSQAVEVTKLNLWACALGMAPELYEAKRGKGPKGKGVRKELPMLELNIKNGNSLISGLRKREELEQYKEKVSELAELRVDMRKTIIQRSPEHARDTTEGEHKALRERMDELRRKEEQLRAEINADVNKSLKEYFEKPEEERPFNWEVEFPEVFEKGGFDAVVGNPPYISNWELTKKDSEMPGILEEMYKDVAYGHWDIYIIFIDKALSLANQGGKVSFIVPNAMGMEKYGKKVREKIIKNFTLESLLDFEESRVFDEVSRQSLIFVISAKSSVNNPTKLFRYKEQGIEELGELQQSTFLDFPNVTYRYVLDDMSRDIKEKLENKSILLGQICCVNEGVVAHSSASSPIRFRKNDVVFSSPKGSTPRKYIEGGDIDRYSVNWRGLWLDYDDKKQYFHRPKFEELFENSKIMVGRVSGSDNLLLCCFDDNGYFSNDSALHLIIWEPTILERQKPKGYSIHKGAHEFSLRTISAILCSKLASWYFSTFLATDTLQGRYTGVYPEDLRRIPIREIDFSNPAENKINNMLGSLVDRMLFLNKQKNELLGLMPHDTAIDFEDIYKEKNACRISALSDTRRADFKNFHKLKIKEFKLRFDGNSLVVHHPEKGELLCLAFGDNDFRLYLTLMFRKWIEDEGDKTFKGKIALPSTLNLKDEVKNILKELKQKVGEVDILRIERDIEETDRTIDKMIYELYELTPEEVVIVENSSADEVKRKYGW